MWRLDMTGSGTWECDRRSVTFRPLVAAAARRMTGSTPPTVVAVAAAAVRTALDRNRRRLIPALDRCMRNPPLK